MLNSYSNDQLTDYSITFSAGKRIRFGFICVHQRICRDELCQCVDVLGVLPEKEV